MGTGRELVLAMLDGTEIPVEVALSPVTVDGRPGTLAIVVDSRERLATLAALEVRARTDALTGLDNRATAEEDLARRMRARAAFSLLAVDLDGLRNANARFGHPGGDQLIKAFARRLSSVVREEDLVARVGGDEFMVAVGTGWRDAVHVASRISGSGAPPIELRGERVGLTASVGIAERRSGESRVALVARADAALYAAKAAGRGAVAVDIDPGGEPVVFGAAPDGATLNGAAPDGAAPAVGADPGTDEPPIVEPPIDGP